MPAWGTGGCLEEASLHPQPKWVRGWAGNRLCQWGGVCEEQDGEGGLGGSLLALEGGRIAELS